MKKKKQEPGQALTIHNEAAKSFLGIIHALMYLLNILLSVWLHNFLS